jgi:MFS-type transporter involved in bile tolerance (Atg22 family)
MGVEFLFQFCLLYYTMNPTQKLSSFVLGITLGTILERKINKKYIIPFVFYIK